jgi:hypothetical protein
MVTWVHDYRYTDKLLAPSLAVQATLAAFNTPSLHKYIQQEDLMAVEDCDDEGEYALLFLNTLDISEWSFIQMIGSTDVDKGLAQLKEAHN